MRAAAIWGRGVLKGGAERNASAARVSVPPKSSASPSQKQEMKTLRARCQPRFIIFIFIVFIYCRLLEPIICSFSLSVHPSPPAIVSTPLPLKPLRSLRSVSACLQHTMQYSSALHGRQRPCAAHTRRVGSNTFSSAPRCSRGALLVQAAVKQRSAREVVISKTLIARPDAKDKVWTLCEEASARAKAAMADRDVGLRAFDCVRDGWDDNVFHFWERYESNVALGRYNSSEPVLEWYKQVCFACARGGGVRRAATDGETHALKRTHHTHTHTHSTRQGVAAAGAAGRHGDVRVEGRAARRRVRAGRCVVVCFVC